LKKINTLHSTRLLKPWKNRKINMIANLGMIVCKFVVWSDLDKRPAALLEEIQVVRGVVMLPTCKADVSWDVLLKLSPRPDLAAAELHFIPVGVAMHS
jgi:hypothetical protein